MRKRLMMFGGSAVLAAGLTVGATQLAASSGEPDAERPAAATEGTTRHERLGLPAGVSYAEAQEDWAFVVWLQAWEQGQAAAFLDGIWANYQAELAAQRAAASAPTYSGSTVSGPCGGASNGADQYIARESGGDPNVYNTGGSGAWGCYQIMPGTWSASCSDLGAHGSASPDAQAQCASRLPLSAWGG